MATIKRGERKTSKGKTDALKPAGIAAWVDEPEKAMGELRDFIVAGGHLNDFCKRRGWAYNTVRDWINADEARKAAYNLAREDRSDTLADEVVSIADEARGGDAAAIARNRLRVDARKWVASKLKPRIYGEKIDITQTSTVRDVSDQALLAKLAELGIDPSVVKLVQA
jgi:hypothetical protein